MDALDAIPECHKPGDGCNLDAAARRISNEPTSDTIHGAWDIAVGTGPSNRTEQFEKPPTTVTKRSLRAITESC